MRWLIKYPTRGRPLWFKKAINNIVSTIHTHDYCILVSADSDDRSMNNADIRDFCDTIPHLRLAMGNSASKIEAVNRDMELTGKWDILLVMSDDMHFQVKGWDVIMEQKIKEVWGDSLDLFAHFNDGYTGDALATMSILGRTYYERDCYIYHPAYKSFSSDSEAWFVARARGCHHYFPDVLFLHQHPTNSPNPKDELYRINSLATPYDIKTYWERLNNDFDMGPGDWPWNGWKGKQPK